MNGMNWFRGKRPEKPECRPDPDSDPAADDNVRAMGRLAQASPAAHRAFENLQDPRLSKEVFFERLEVANDTFIPDPADPPQGMYTRVSEEISANRRVSVKIFENGGVVFSGEDHS